MKIELDIPDNIIAMMKIQGQTPYQYVITATIQKLVSDFAWDMFGKYFGIKGPGNK